MHELTTCAAEIRRHHEAARIAAATAIDHALAIGKLLCEAKEGMQHGTFGAWVSEHCGFSDRTARRYMQLHQHRDTLPDGAGIKVALHHMATPKPKTDTVSEIRMVPLDSMRTDTFGSLGAKPIFLPDIGSAAFASVPAGALYIWQVEGNYAHALLLGESEYHLTKRPIRYDWLIDELELMGVKDIAGIDWEPVSLRLALKLRENTYGEASQHWGEAAA
jgi:Protein of unknown function (DUF3102)